MMTNIRSLDMLFVDDLVKMGSPGTGYVLNFSDRTFAKFFAEELDVDIDDPVYAVNGGSKRNRLRHFLQTVDKPTVIRTLRALWEYREELRQRLGQSEDIQNAHGRFLALISRLSGGENPETTGDKPKPAFNKDKQRQLLGELMNISQLEPHPRGYAFEKFLQNLFEAHDLNPREPFRNRGEQIDGSFEFQHQTYLVEAKWHNEKTGASDLHVFQGKLEQKAKWARGLFISNSGFTVDGLFAIGRGKSFICMDGLDIYDCLSREIPLAEVLARKLRSAVETGLPFAGVRELF